MAQQVFAGNTLTRPPWAADYLNRDHLMPGAILIDKTQFLPADGAYVNVDTPGAAIDATSIPVLALLNPIPVNTFLNFGTLAAVLVTLNGAVARGATSLTVTALPGAIPAGAILRFGNLAAVTATVGVAGALATATSIPVAALSGPIPVGTVLYFGTNKFAVLTAAAATSDTSLTVAALPTALVSGDAATFIGGGQFAEVTVAAAAADTTLTVRPVPLPILTALTATFYGGTKQARVTTAANIGDTSIAVDELEFALFQYDQATYNGAGLQKRKVLSGTYLGRTFAERTSGDGFGPVAHGDDERFLVAFEVPDLDIDASAAALRHNAAVKENLLPDYTAYDSTILGYLRADYSTQKGAP